MPKVPESRRIGRMAVNEARALLERHGHIVQEIDGGNDHGEDLHVTFVHGGQRTEDSVAVQVKGGVAVRTRRGHRVRVGDHVENWRDGSLPVLCVVHDPERGGLFWANATRQLRRAEALRKTVKSIVISRDAVLNDTNIDTFVQTMRRYLAWERKGSADGRTWRTWNSPRTTSSSPSRTSTWSPWSSGNVAGNRALSCSITTWTGSLSPSKRPCSDSVPSRRSGTSSSMTPKRTG